MGGWFTLRPPQPRLARELPVFMEMNMPDPTSTTIIGADTHIKGDMSFESTARILGTFEGKISSKGELQVANGATCRASVDASKVLVDGEVDGNLMARER